MAIVLNPEQEQRVNEALRSGGYSNAQEVLDRALEMLHAQEEWFTENREDIAAAIDEGLDQAARGELIGGDEVRTRMAARKKLWLNENRGV